MMHDAASGKKAGGEGPTLEWLDWGDHALKVSSFGAANQAQSPAEPRCSRIK